MSIKERKLAQIDRSLQHRLNQAELAETPLKRRLSQTLAWGYGLYREIVKNDVTIRAESLSYFTLFSIMPLIAGIFLVLGLISQYAPVQKEFEDLLANFLQAIPDEQRDVLMDFILQFKDDYLARLSKQSAALGVFAFGILLWVSGKVFFNLETLMNHIWAARSARPFFERIQNFILCMVILPIGYVSALSLPGVLEHYGHQGMGILLRQGIPIFIIFFSLAFVFRYFPNTRVAWRSAWIGAFASTIVFGVSKFFLSFYFKFGTSTAYGKVAILPIFAFFIYVSWIIFILGVEVSLLVQASPNALSLRLPETTLGEALILEKILALFEQRFQNGEGPLETLTISRSMGIGYEGVAKILEFLQRRQVISLIWNEKEKDSSQYVLTRSLTPPDLLLLIKDYLDLSELSQSFDVFGLLSRLKQT